jgi:hypothetical protein
MQELILVVVCHWDEYQTAKFIRVTELGLFELWGLVYPFSVSQSLSHYQIKLSPPPLAMPDPFTQTRKTALLIADSC